MTFGQARCFPVSSLFTKINKSSAGCSFTLSGQCGIGLLIEVSTRKQINILNAL